MAKRTKRPGASSPAPHEAAIERLPAPPGFRFRPPSRIYAMRTTGDCMEPLIFEGDVLIIDPFAGPEPDNVVVFEREHCMFVKMLVADSDGLALVAINGPEFRFPVDERVNIVGVVTFVQFSIPDRHREARSRATAKEWAAAAGSGAEAGGACG